MLFRPRDYQLRCLDNIFHELEDVNSTLFVLPTGTGKTSIFSMVINQWLNTFSSRVMVVAHREELIFQAKKRVKEISGVDPAVEMAEMRAEETLILGKAPVVITSVQTQNSGPVCKTCVCYGCLGKCVIQTGICPNCKGKECELCKDGFTYARCEDCAGKGRSHTTCTRCIDGRRLRMQNFNPSEFGLLVVDEGHRAVSKSYRRMFRYYSKAKVAACTATADRADEEALGQVFASVAMDYQIQDAINDGWLVPIDQRMVRVEELDFSEVGTVGDDFNQSELQHALLPAMDIDRANPLNDEEKEKLRKEERLLHGMVGPTIELAGDMPTLIFAASVQHAERVAEIINRHHDGAAVCIHGGTPTEERRTQLKRFKAGDFQFLCSCEAFLEGYDEPRIACIAWFRATKSRSLYAQGSGRGTRPLPGVVDGEHMDAESRKEAIAMSSKPSCTILDYVGNSGKHKLITAADLLGGHYSDDVVQLAKAAISRKNAGGKSADTLAELRTAQKKVEEIERQKRREIIARARFTTQNISPFDIYDLAPGREPGWFKGKKPTERMLALLQKNGVDTVDMSFWAAKCIIGEIMKRRDENKCSYKMAKILAKNGYDTNVSFEEAKRLIDQISAEQGWAKRK